MSVLVLNDDNFESEILNSEKTCLVDFFATWCGPCKIMSPVIDEIAAENPDIKVGKVDVDEAEEIAARFGIMSIPTLMVFKGGESVKTFVGVTDKDAILAELK
ncbi:MAG: thioredoxin [Clostridiaceae bacterium]|nr:thioredoxin [Clostridiaceae bacterium]